MNRNAPDISECFTGCGMPASVQLWVPDLADHGVGAWAPYCSFCALEILQARADL